MCIAHTYMGALSYEKLKGVVRIWAYITKEQYIFREDKAREKMTLCFQGWHIVGTDRRQGLILGRFAM